MGGSALTKYGVNTRRVNLEEFNNIKKTVMPKILNIFSKAEVVISYLNKKDFGDMDILVTGLVDPSKSVSLQLQKEFPTSAAFYNNSPTWSFEFTGFQIDIIYVEPVFWETSVFYYSYNDLNNLVGRIAHACGLSFGHEGLKYTYRTETNYVFGEIIISTDPRSIYEFLGYSYDRYLLGFRDLNDIFDFVTTSEYFDTEKFNLDDSDMSHQNRTRNRKRKTFMEFLDYVKTLEQRAYFVGQDKLLHIFRAEKFFKDACLLKQMEMLFYRERINKNNSFKYNGELVMSWTGLTGKDLGAVLEQYKNSKNDFPDFINENSAEFIKLDFIKWRGKKKK